MRPCLEPITINGLVVKNRVVRTAHGTNIGQGRVNDDLIAYHLARARGGVGLTMLEAASVHPTDTGTLRLHNDSCIADFRRLMEQVEPTGMRVFTQLNHLGHDGAPMPPYTESWSASAVRSPGYGWVTHAMTLEEIEELIACFGRVAGWAREGGMHGVEVHSAHGYLLQQFLSPVTNQRTDHYGGSFENRLRLTLDVVAAVRHAVGPDFVVGLRTGADATEDGLQADDSADVMHAVVDTGLIDYVNVTYGSCHKPHKVIGAMHEVTGYELPTSEVVTKATSLPTIVTGRFRTLDEADEVIDSGVADMVALTRAHIADPEIVLKTMSGRAHEVRLCLACNQGCVGGFSQGRLACTVNSDVGFERERVGAYDRSAVQRSVLVVGGGPAGMEAARVAAVRGHRVVLCEASDSLGGNIRWSRRFSRRATIGDSIDWLAREVERLGVDVRLKTMVDFATIAAIEPEVVVVATGGLATNREGELDAADIARMDEAPPGARTAVVVDRVGGYEVLGVVERLAEWGIAAEVCTPFDVLAPKVQRELVVVPTMERLRALPGTLTVHAKWDGGPPTADVRIVIDRTPTGALDVGDRELHVVGDALEIGNLWAAIRTGNAAGRAIA